MGAPWRDTPHWAVVGRLSESTGRDVAELLLRTGADRLTRTDNAQLATLALELVVLDALRAALPGLRPVVCAGHSLGEYAALVGAGVLTPEDAGRLVAERGAAMAEAVRAAPGTMTVLIGPGVAAAAARFAAEPEAGRRARAWVANINGPDQVVVSGTAAGVAALTERAVAAGARAVAIPVGGPFHTPLMAGARPRLAAALARTPFHPAHCPVVANVDGRAHRRDHRRWPGLLLRQLVMPVRWAGGMRTLAALPGTGRLRLVELGPGRVLAGLGRRLLGPDLPIRSVATPAELAALTAQWGQAFPSGQAVPWGQALSTPAPSSANSPKPTTSR
jgi:[acyl-carrier-protein] S-malonyltransferase